MIDNSIINLSKVAYVSVRGDKTILFHLDSKIFPGDIDQNIASYSFDSEAERDMFFAQLVKNLKAITNFN